MSKTRIESLMEERMTFANVLPMLKDAHREIEAIRWKDTYKAESSVCPHIRNQVVDVLAKLGESIDLLTGIDEIENRLHEHMIRCYEKHES